MYTSSLPQSFSPRQPSLRGGDSHHNHHSRAREAEGGRHNNRLSDDSYQSSKLSKPEESRPVNSVMAVQSVSTSVNHSAEIQVTTKEGDVVTISLNESESNSRTAFQAEQGDDNISAYSETNSATSGFTLSIEGDLNEDEQKSLTDLINKMAKVTDKFFDGNVKSAFKHAQKIGFDTDQIAGFSMDLTKEKSVQAVAAYQQTTVPEQSVNTDLLKQAGDFLTQTKAFMDDAGAMLDSFSEPKQSFTDLFAGVGQMNRVAEDEMDNDDQPLFLKMIDSVSKGVFEDL